MTKEVMVQIEGIGEHTADEQVTSASRGNYFLSAGQHCVEFSETIEGLETPLNTRLEFSPGLLRLQRTGAVETTMVFEEGTVSVCEYQSPFGMMELQMITREVVVDHMEQELNIKVRYDMSAGEETLRDCRIAIHVTATH